jgi:peptidoglycan/LPS O-acetylase OafA/YrhL
VHVAGTPIAYLQATELRADSDDPSSIILFHFCVVLGGADTVRLSGVPLSDILERGNNNFDLVRLLAAALVIISHSFSIVYGTAGAEPLASISAYTLGQHSVNVFFILSGLLVSASLDRSQGIASFAIARVLRVFPGLIVCVLVVAAIVGPVVTTLDVASYFSSPKVPNYVLTTLSLTTALAPLPGVFEALPMAGQVNLPLWSLKYEILSYAILTMIAALGVWRRSGLFWSFFVVLLVTHLVVESGHSRVEQHVTVDQALRFLLCFFLGATAYRMRHVLRLTAIGALCAVLMLVLTRQTAFEETVSYVAIGYLTLCFAALPVGRIRGLCSRADISYGLYIYGWPAAQTVLFLVPGIEPVALAAASLAVAAIFAAASWFLIERPALRLKLGARPISARAEEGALASHVP